LRPGSKPRSVALGLLSGIYLILQALVSFGCGGYLAGRCRILYDAGIIDDVESRDGLQGFAAWALAAVISAALTALVAMGASRPTNLAQPGNDHRAVRAQL
jgi:hypothetical protein